jgi:hypothetical protein
MKMLWKNYSVLSEKELEIPQEILNRLEGSTVLASFDSGAGYLYTDYGLSTMGSSFLRESVQDRESMLNGIDQIAINQGIRDLLSKYSVEYVFVNSRSMNGVALPNPEMISSSGNFERLYTNQGISIWRLKSLVFGPVTSVEFTFKAEDKSYSWLTEKITSIDAAWIRSRLQSQIVKLRFMNNPCRSVSSVILVGQKYDLTGLDYIDIDYVLEPTITGTARIAVETISQPCKVEGLPKSVGPAINISTT